MRRFLGPEITGRKPGRRDFRIRRGRNIRRARDRKRCGSRLRRFRSREPGSRKYPGIHGRKRIG